jgi:hypothetical protein
VTNHSFTSALLVLRAAAPFHCNAWQQLLMYGSIAAATLPLQGNICQLLLQLNIDISRLAGLLQLLLIALPALLPCLLGLLLPPHAAAPCCCP